MTSKAAQCLHEWHHKFDIPVAFKPVIPEEQRRKLRIDLIWEEFLETKAASETGDIVGVADGLRGSPLRDLRLRYGVGYPA